MNVDWNAEVVDQLESHWRGQLRPRLVGLTDEEYFWQPVPGCWTLSRRGQSSAPTSWGSGDFTMDYAEPPYDRVPVTTIAWRLAHMIVTLGSSTATRLGGPPATDVTWHYAGTANEALRQLDEQYATWINGVRALGAAGLAEPQGWPPAFALAPVVRAILYVDMEVIHHGSEVCLLRDLYLHRGAGELSS